MSTLGLGGLFLGAGGWRAVPPQLPGVPSCRGPRHAGVRTVNSQAAAGKALSPRAGTARLRAGTAALAGAASTACVSVPVCTGEENAFPLGNELQSGVGPESCAVPPADSGCMGVASLRRSLFQSWGCWLFSCSLAPLPSGLSLWAGGRTSMGLASTFQVPCPRSFAGGGGGVSQTLLPLGQCPESREVPHTASPRHPSLFLHNCCPPGSPPAPSRQCGVSHRRLVVLSGPPSPQPPCHGRGQRMPVPLLQTLADGRDSVRAWQSIPGDLWG